MAWRLMLGVALMTLTLGCDVGSSGPPIGPSFISPISPAGLSISIVSGGSVLTTTAFPGSPLTVPRGSTIACLDNVNPPLTAPIVGTLSPGLPPLGGGASVTLRNTGTFTFGCDLRPGIIVTIIVV
jgi:hypothetical protein